MLSRKLLLLLASPAFLCVAVAQDQELAPIASFVECSPLYRKPGFNSVQDFVTSVQVGKAPWRKLFASDPNPEVLKLPIVCR